MAPILEAIGEGFGNGSSGLHLRVFGELDPAAKRVMAMRPMPGRVDAGARIPAAELAGHLRGADALLQPTADEPAAEPAAEPAVVLPMV